MSETELEVPLGSGLESAHPGGTGAGGRPDAAAAQAGAGARDFGAECTAVPDKVSKINGVRLTAVPDNFSA